MDGYSYDSAGNLLYDNVHHYFYDAENRLIQVDGSLPYCTSNGASGSAPTACYYYDARGSGFVLANPEIKIAHRVHRTGIDDNPCTNDGNGGSGDFVFDLDGNWTSRTNSSGGSCASEIYLAGRHFGTSDNGSIYFDHSDWLGTSRLRNTQADVVNGYTPETCTSLPFGDGLLCNSTYGSNIHFTGKEHDYETGLDDFGARFDASSFGRFMTPDWSEVISPVPYASVTDPQSLNLYAYVDNNPIGRTDPTGHCTSGGEEKGFWWCVGHALGFNETTEEYNARIATERQWLISNVAQGSGQVDALRNYSSAQVDKLYGQWDVALRNAACSGLSVCEEVPSAEDFARTASGGFVLYRGGSSFDPSAKDYRLDAEGNVKPTRGVSVNTDPTKVERFGGAYEIKLLPPELQAVENNPIGNPGHFEIVPRQPMPLSRYIALLRSIVTELFKGPKE